MIANNYKIYGFSKLGDDFFITTVGSIGSIFNGVFRIVWACLYNKSNFKKVFFTLLVIQVRSSFILLFTPLKAILCGTFDLVSGNKAAFLIWYDFSMGTFGGLFSLFPSVTTKVFGIT
jgi:hypothetical protein